MFAVGMIGGTVTAIVACGSAPPLYGPKSCTSKDPNGKDVYDGYVAYLPPQANAAICMPPEAAVYITCVRELSQTSFNSTNSHSVDVNAAPLVQAAVGAFGTKEAAEAVKASAEALKSAAESSTGSKKDGGAAGKEKNAGGADGGASSDSTGTGSTFATKSNTTLNVVFSDDGRKAAFEYCKSLAVAAYMAQIHREDAGTSADGRLATLLASFPAASAVDAGADATTR